MFSWLSFRQYNTMVHFCLGGGTIMTRLRLWREEHNWTQARAAQELGISRASYIPLERGLVRPSRGMVTALEGAFGDCALRMIRPIRARALT